LIFLTLALALTVIGSSVFAVHISTEAIKMGTKWAYRKNESVEHVWEAFMTLGNLASFAMNVV